MSANKDKKLNCSSSKDLLYSEIVRTSVSDHVRALLQKKKKSSTFHVQRSPVVDKVSKLLQSLKEAENDVKNLEIIEEGEPVIDMSVTLIDRHDESESESDSDTEHMAEAKDRKLIVSLDSDSDICSPESDGKKSQERSILFSDSDSELSENEISDNVLKVMFSCSDLDKTVRHEKEVKTSINDINTVTEESRLNHHKESKLFVPNANSEQLENKSSGVLAVQNNNFLDSDDELTDQEKYLDQSKLNLVANTCVPTGPISKQQSYLHESCHSGEKKRKLNHLIEEIDEGNTCLSTKQKRISVMQN